MLAPRRKLWSSPEEAVRVALEMVDVGPSDRVVDLGCGDGRFVVAAARRGARALGVEIEPSRAEEARKRAIDAGVEVEILCENALTVSLEGATVIYLYLVPRGLGLIAPRLLGERRTVVSYVSPIPGLRYAEKRTCSPAHQPEAAWPLYKYLITEETRLS